MTVHLIFVQLFVVCLRFSPFTTILFEVRCEEQCMPVIKHKAQSVTISAKRKEEAFDASSARFNTDGVWDGNAFTEFVSSYFLLSHTHKHTQHSSFFVLSNHFIKKKSCDYKHPESYYQGLTSQSLTRLRAKIKNITTQIVILSNRSKLVI